MNPLIALALIGLASYRVWRFIARDEFVLVRVPREAIVKRSPTWVDELIQCPWCAGSWVTIFVTAATAWYTSVPAPVLVGAAAAAVVGLLAQIDEG